MIENSNLSRETRLQKLLVSCPLVPNEQIFLRFRGFSHVLASVHADAQPPAPKPEMLPFLGNLSEAAPAWACPELRQ